MKSLLLFMVYLTSGLFCCLVSSLSLSSPPQPAISTTATANTKKSSIAISADNFFDYHSRFGAHRIRWKNAVREENLRSNPNVLCLHGFGGNCDQYRYNIPTLCEQGFNTYGMDFIGYGYSDKPSPKAYKVNELYNFETWADQTISFIENVMQAPEGGTVLVCNSVGGIAGLLASILRPDLIKGVVLIDISLRMLHESKQNPFQRPVVSFIQTVLRESGLGNTFFDSIAKPRTIKNILSQAYAAPVDDEIVDVILKPGLEPGAADVFLDFISYSSGPLPEDLLPRCTRPVRILWGENDPWEPIDMGRQYGQYACVDEFVTLKGAGHCPMDQVPDLVNAQLLRFLREKMV